MLKDNFGRIVNYLRLSVTDRCDFRCVYCMAEEMQFVKREELLTIEEMTLVATAFTELGVSKIRVTGGEPLIRRNIITLFENLGKLEQLKELTLTTNGSQLKKLSQQLIETGVKRVNISLDSLKEKRFQSITRTGELKTVLEGIDSAIETGLRVKINSVILKNRNSDEVVDLINFIVNKKIDISFIEEMPLGVIDEHNRKEEFVSSKTLRDIIQSRFSLLPTEASDVTSGPSRYWKIKGHQSNVGFISPHSENFCQTCNRVRLTATGQLLLCLGNEHSVDLKSVVREHPNNISLLKKTILDAMNIKPEAHDFTLAETPQILRFMNTTGG
ncbi:MAG: GTP 3',8-cyclase MoaA [Cellvibrionaceae bacterium]